MGLLTEAVQAWLAYQDARANEARREMDERRARESRTRLETLAQFQVLAGPDWSVESAFEVDAADNHGQYTRKAWLSTLLGDDDLPAMTVGVSAAGTGATLHLWHLCAECEKWYQGESFGAYSPRERALLDLGKALSAKVQAHWQCPVVRARIQAAEEANRAAIYARIEADRVAGPQPRVMASEEVALLDALRALVNPRGEYEEV